MASNEVMMTIKPGEHGSTYGGNPLGTIIAIEAIKALLDEKMVENSEKVGKVFLEGLQKLKRNYMKDIRGRGLFCAIEFAETSKYSGI